MLRGFALPIAGALALALIAGCGGDDGHGGHTENGGHGESTTAADITMPKTLKDGVHHLQGLAAKIQAYAEGGGLAKVHAAANEARLVAEHLVEMVQDHVAAEHRKHATKACRDIAAMFPKLDKAGDSGNKAETLKLAGVLKGHIGELAKAAGVEAHADETGGIAIDPVCGMDVQLSAGALQHEHDGKTYFF